MKAFGQSMSLENSSFFAVVEQDDGVMLVRISPLDTVNVIRPFCLGLDEATKIVQYSSTPELDSK